MGINGLKNEASKGEHFRGNTTQIAVGTLAPKTENEGSRKTPRFLQLIDLLCLLQTSSQVYIFY